MGGEKCDRTLIGLVTPFFMFGGGLLQALLYVILILYSIKINLKEVKSMIETCGFLYQLLDLLGGLLGSLLGILF
ncbi:MAG: hypothetical protein ACPK7O_03450 [Methanobacterium sp.]